MATVTVENRDRMNILGLILAAILERNLEDPARARQLRRLDGEVVVRAGQMAVTLGFGPDDVVRIRREAAERPRASLESRLHVLSELAMGRGIVSHVLGRRLRFRGNLFLLLRTWRILRVDSPRHRDT